MIGKAHSKACKKYFSLSGDFEFNSQRKQIVCLPYAKAFESLNNNLEASDLKVVHRFPNTVEKTLIKNISSYIEKAGVYKIPGMDYNKSYYGETGRSFDIRLAEYRRDVQNCNTSNAAFIHKIENDHCIKWNSAQLLFKSNNYFTRRIVESSLIACSPNFNISPGNYKFHKVLQASILKATGLLSIT